MSGDGSACMKTPVIVYNIIEPKLLSCPLNQIEN